MPRKKKKKPAATAQKQKGSSTVKSKSARKAAAKKRKPESEVLPVLNSDKLKELYATMLKCRMLAERVQGAQTSGLESDRSIRGFEATLVGAGTHLLSKDCIALEHSGFVASLIKGTPLQSILARNEHQTGNGTGKSASSRHDGNAAAILSMDTVISLAAEMKGKTAVTLTFCMQHTETLIFDPASMAMAATQKLPLVCLVESSFDSRLELPTQIASGPYVGADAAFYPRIPVDGADAVAVFRVTQEAIRRAREGHGPAVIECLTSRGSAIEQTTDGNSPAQYTAQDPLTFMEQYLRRRDLWSDQWSQSIIETFNRDLDVALTSLENTTDSEGKFDNVYSSDVRAPRPSAASAH
ncbi:MAG TPA: thiamine pyrophosphate-dependent enzyme [Candidatus Polarisedimenticolia bacterium]|jgi:TPP-dependent pyruvate/acetoin dehydrogenase alpha subunit|nr:thiamine pyrophosphate-dependent enzyme [Candidatus Polarisedimenticolia bacterium]